MSYLSPSELAYQEAHINENRAPTLIASVAVLVSLSSISIFLRITTRIMTKVGFRADDFIIFVAWILVWGGFVGVYYETLNGLGKHVIAVRPEEFVGIVKTVLWAGPDFFITVMLTQISILCLYKRTFTTIKDWFRISIYVLGVLSLLTGLSITIAFLSKCSPFSYAWTRYSLDSNAAFNHKKGHCVKGIGYLYPAHAIVTVLIDTSIVLMPLPTIRHLQFSAGMKRAIAGMFLLGGFVAIINLVRLPQLFNVRDHDYTYTDVDAVIWTQAELNLGIVCASLPIFKPLLRRCKEMFTSIRSTSHGTVSQPRTKPSLGSYKVFNGKESSVQNEGVIPNREHSSQPDVELGGFPQTTGVTHDVESLDAQRQPENSRDL